MTPNESAAWIAAGVSALTASITYFSTVWKTRKELDGAFATRLQELRLKHYPEAFNITEDLGKKLSRSPQEASTRWLEIAQELRSWKAGVSALIMSERSLDGFYKINESMKAKPALGDHHGKEQITRIRNAREEFRLSLRDDIGLQ